MIDHNDLTPQHELVLKIFTEIPKIYGSTRIQKLIFLVQKKMLNRPIFLFFPHHYGPYSRTLKHTCIELEELGLIEKRKIKNDNSTWTEYRITEEGEMLGNLLEFRELDSTKIKDWGYMTMENLIEKVYTEHPEYAENSKIKKEVLFRSLLKELN